MSAGYQDYGWNDRSVQSTGYIYPVLRDMLRHDTSKRILDMGCGNGQIANLLIRDGFNVVGIDASFTGVEIANRKNPGRFFVHDVSKDELPGELGDPHFDVVISTEVIEHLYAPRAYMGLVQKTLRSKRGDVILSTPYHGYFKNIALALAGKMDHHYTALWDGGHIKFWSRETLTKLLEEFDFRVTDFRGAGRLPYLWKSMLVRASLRG
jgi:2-polyprenyl-3-methyl-5-hydroxy-6-metoxy-1,4-benzoquinol methylase